MILPYGLDFLVLILLYVDVHMLIDKKVMAV